MKCDVEWQLVEFINVSSAAGVNICDEAAFAFGFAGECILFVCACDFVHGSEVFGSAFVVGGKR